MRKLLLLTSTTLICQIALGQVYWLELNPGWGYIWLDGEHTDKEFYLPVDTDQLDSVTFTTLVAKARSEDGAGLKFNDGTQLFLREGCNSCVQLQTLKVPLKDLKQGVNKVRFESFHSEGQKYNNDSYALKLYFRGDKPPEGIWSIPELTFTPPPKKLGELVKFSAQTKDFQGIDRVEYWVLANHYPASNTKKPEFNDWNLVAVSDAYPFEATWDTKLFPDQKDMKIKAVAYNNANVAVSSAVSESHFFERKRSTTRFWMSDVEEVKFWKGPPADTITYEMDLPKQIHEMYMVFTAWLGAKGYYTEGASGTVTVNGHEAMDIQLQTKHPHAWTTKPIKLDPGHWKNGRNELIFRTLSPYRKSMMMSTPPGPVIYMIHEK
jgi:hypothetical protein